LSFFFPSKTMPRKGQRKSLTSSLGLQKADFEHEIKISRRPDGKAIIENEVCLGEGQNPVFKIKYGRKYVAVKVICDRKKNKSLKWLDNARLEYQIAADLSKAPDCHKHVVCMYEDITKETDAGPVYVMLMEMTKGPVGNDIKHQNFHKKPWTLAQTKRYLMDMVAGLAYIHSRGIAHMDIKPTNIMMVKGDHLKYADFGLSCRRVSTSASQNDVCEHGTGSPLWAAPEFLSSNGDFRPNFPDPTQHHQWAKLDVVDMFMRADVFSLGVTAFGLIHNQHPSYLGVDAYTMYQRHAIDLPKSDQNWPRWGKKQRPSSHQLDQTIRHRGAQWERVYAVLDRMTDVSPFERPTAQELTKMVIAL
jgi:serine/threonine protein kinase